MPSSFEKIMHYIRTGELRFLVKYALNKGPVETTKILLNAFKEAMTIGDFYESHLDELKEYRHSYPFSPRKGAIHMMWWDFKTLFKNANRLKVDDFKLSEDVVNIMILPNGGLGDYLMNANYVYRLRQKYKDSPLRIDIVSKEHFYGPTKAVFESDHDCPVDGIYSEDHRKFAPLYDVVIDISRYPVLVRYNLERIGRVCPEFLEYIHLCERFRFENYEMIMKRPFLDGEGATQCIKQGKTRIMQSDIYGFLGTTEEFCYPMKMPDEKEVFKRLNIPDGNYISMHRGCDTDYSKDSIKLWPEEYYQTLTDMIKQKYPDLPIVQLGVSHKRCATIRGTDLNLIEKTSIDDIKVILKHALIHIDCEGGMVHMRHAVKGGPSIVIFGPTPLEFYGYSENENIKGDGCDRWCEWATRNWQEGCMKGFEKHPCMYSISPETVMASVEKLLNNGKQTH